MNSPPEASVEHVAGPPAGLRLVVERVPVGPSLSPIVRLLHERTGQYIAESMLSDGPHDLRLKNERVGEAVTFWLPLDALYDSWTGDRIQIEIPEVAYRTSFVWPRVTVAQDAGLDASVDAPLHPTDGGDGAEVSGVPLPAIHQGSNRRPTKANALLTSRSRSKIKRYLIASAVVGAISLAMLTAGLAIVQLQSLQEGQQRLAELNEQSRQFAATNEVTRDELARERRDLASSVAEATRQTTAIAEREAKLKQDQDAFNRDRAAFATERNRFYERNGQSAQLAAANQEMREALAREKKELATKLADVQRQAAAVAERDAALRRERDTFEQERATFVAEHQRQKRELEQARAAVPSGPQAPPAQPQASPSSPPSQARTPAPAKPTGPVAATPSVSPQNSDALSCDTMAGNPSDPRRNAAVPGTPYPSLRAAAPAAILVCERASQSAPNELRLRYQLGRALQASGDHSRAMEIMNELTRAGYPAAFDNLGNLHYRGGDVDNALRAFRSGVAAADPDSMVSLAALIDNNEVLARHNDESDQLLTRAAELGHAGAKSEVARRRAETETFKQVPRGGLRMFGGN